MQKKENKGIARDVIETIIYMIIGVIVSLLIINYIGQLTRVDGSSMENTLHHGETIILDKISYRFHEPNRFDVIVFPVKKDNNKNYIKRIIGMPGEKVQIIEGKIYINDELLEENYGKEKIETAGEAAIPIVLEKDEYFVLGDNRNHSSDSRTVEVGNIKRSQILGRAWLRVWPLAKTGMIKHQ
ncbi:signal peptidase I [Anaerosacchariphilus polymeriproducens]|uniref:Signal peptidase I n=1 Tax=Anaerosacchariphilus polymeriproducens TaxID=1812858 RepID=A0A371ATN7_9FIRM|nr:signal peptidase I [Anaerosacchariphilus polymeriproducens]RDU22928.1 signal peptidase I [Anaerosacchariphilus polymeriproducens]